MPKAKNEWRVEPRNAGYDLVAPLNSARIFIIEARHAYALCFKLNAALEAKKVLFDWAWAVKLKHAATLGPNPNNDDIRAYADAMERQIKAFEKVQALATVCYEELKGQSDA